jgi:hypothetical protein
MTAFAHHAPLFVSAGLTDITALTPGIDAMPQRGWGEQCPTSAEARPVSYATVRVIGWRSTVLQRACDESSHLQKYMLNCRYSINS